MTLEQQVRKMYKYGFSSSPQKLSKTDLALIIKTGCECEYCGKSVFEMYDFPNITNDELLCEDCYMEKYYETCPICETSFEKPEKPIDEVLVISKESAKECQMGIEPGFYQVLKYPYFYGNCVTGFDRLFNDNLKLIRACDINSMLYKLYPYGGRYKINADSCCPDCMLKYTGQSEIKNNYCNKRYGKQRVKLEKQVIADGK